MSGNILFSGNAFSVADGKGRFVLPLDMRKLIREASNDKTILITSIDEKRGCATGFGISHKQALEDEIVEKSRAALTRGDEYDADAERERLFAPMDDVNFDDGGRFSLSEGIKDVTGITDIAFFVGVSRHIQIWSPEHYLASEGRPELMKNKVRRFLAEREGARK